MRGFVYVVVKNQPNYWDEWGFKGNQRFGAMVVGLIGEHGGVGEVEEEKERKN